VEAVQGGGRPADDGGGKDDICGGKKGHPKPRAAFHRGPAGPPAPQKRGGNGPTKQQQARKKGSSPRATPREGVPAVPGAWHDAATLCPSVHRSHHRGYPPGLERTGMDHALDATAPGAPRRRPVTLPLAATTGTAGREREFLRQRAARLPPPTD